MLCRARVSEGERDQLLETSGAHKPSTAAAVEGSLTALRELAVRDHYRSDGDDLVTEFYEPCLSAAVRYDRAVGYFTSTSLALAASGLDVLAQRGGKVRLIASPHLTAEDIEQIELGYEYRGVIEQALIRELSSAVEESEVLHSRLGLLGLLVGQGVLDIRIALVRRAERLSLYHEKIGIFVDSEGDQVVFTGSANETASALIDNFESIEVFRSWESTDTRRCDRIARNFVSLWNGSTPHVEVLEFPQIGRDRLLELSRTARERGLDQRNKSLAGGIPIGAGASAFSLPVMPVGLQPREYQRQAVRDWFLAGGRGMFEMATGTGKTITALIALTKLAETYEKQRRPLLAIVVAPQKHLVDQWAHEVSAFGVRPLCCYDDAKTWVDAAQVLTTGLTARGQGFAMLIATNAALTREHLQRTIANYRGPLVLVADEAHNLGGAAGLTALPEAAEHRLALSATPERWFDPVGTQGLFDYFGPSLIKLGLREAIAIGALCEYNYYPVPVRLDEQESQRYSELSIRIARLAGSGDGELESGGEELSRLLQQRAQVLAHASGKIVALEEQLRTRADQPWQLVYCAEGTAPGAGSGQRRQIDEVVRRIGLDLSIPCHAYTDAEDRAERSGLLQRFRDAELRVLVSMRCLDEGVDVPDARVAYLLASTTNPRQFIQRRGRVLRKAGGKEYAEIVDFIAVPNGEIDMRLERRLLRREIERFTEFASCARNAGEALAVMRPLRVQYNLMDV